MKPRAFTWFILLLVIPALAMLIAHHTMTVIVRDNDGVRGLLGITALVLLTLIALALNRK